MNDANLVAEIDWLAHTNGWEAAFPLLVSIAQRALERNGVSVEVQKYIDKPHEKLYSLEFQGQILRFAWKEYGDKLA